MPSPRTFLTIIELRFDVPPDCSVELSPLGYQFFTDVFETFDKVRPQSPVS